MKALAVAVGLLSGLAACRATAGEEVAPERSEHALPTERGLYHLVWRAVPEPIPRNRPFDVEVRVFESEDGKLRPVTDGRLSFHAGMPAHGHGMNRRPEVERRGDAHVVRGALFHMRGEWRITLAVSSPRGVDLASFLVDV